MQEARLTQLEPALPDEDDDDEWNDDEEEGGEGLVARNSDTGEDDEDSAGGEDSSDEGDDQDEDEDQDEDVEDDEEGKNDDDFEQAFGSADEDDQLRCTLQYSSGCMCCNHQYWLCMYVCVSFMVLVQ